MAADDTKLICVIGDEDTVTGFLLAGIGQRDSSGANFLVVDAKTSREAIEKAFTTYMARDDVGLLIINQPIADAIRPLVNGHTAILPMILEIPSKDVAYNPAKDPLMKRVLQMLGEGV